MDSPKRKRSLSTSSSSIQKAPKATTTETDTDTRSGQRKSNGDNHRAESRTRDERDTVTMTESPSGSLSQHPKVSETSEDTTNTTHPHPHPHSEYSSVASVKKSIATATAITGVSANVNTTTTATATANTMSDTTNATTNPTSTSTSTSTSTTSEDQQQLSDASEWVTIEAQSCRGIYGLGISAVAPRPIAVITSKSSNGDLNCAPFSYTGLLSHDPPMVAHGLCLSRNGRKKDTLVNIEQTKQWVYNVLSDHWIHEANACSEEFDRDVNELDMVGLDTLPCDMVDGVTIPRVKQALVSMECVLESTKEIYNDEGRHTTTVVFGRIVKYHIHKSVLGGTLEKPVVKLEQIRFCGRVGDITYWPAGSGKALPLKRP